jgi:simple sugar transport system ATP-binding protein
MASVLSAQNISKSFQDVRALGGANLELRAGEVHALMGENGAGKSTLIKVLTGIYSRDGGTISLNGTPIAPKSSAEAQSLGISTVYQEVNLIPTLSVAENIYLGREPMKFGRIDWKKVYAGAKAALAKLSLDIDVRKPLEDYSIAIQQMTAIARALDQKAQVLILDESTSSLDNDEVKQLFDVVRGLKAQGLAILFVTHFLDQVYDVCDRITVLRNGQFVGEWAIQDLPRVELVAKMMGQELAAFDPKAEAAMSTTAAAHETWLECKSYGRKGTIAPFNLKVRKGETLGLAGLLGSGRTEIARLLFGLDDPDQGVIEIDGKSMQMKNPRDAVRAGFALCPEDRKAQSIFPELSVRENIILALQARKGWFSFISRKKQNEIADKYIKAMRIRTPDAEQPIQNLSGGNQQKAILARWLALEPRLLILDEPTRGIDVGAKAEIQKLMVEFSESGKSALFISSELEEIVRCCDRVMVLKDRAVVGELPKGRIGVRQIMGVIAGETQT